MALSRLAVLLVVGLGSLGVPGAIRAQDLTAPTKKQQEAFWKVQELLGQVIDTGPFQEEMPLTKFLEKLEQQLPKDKKLALRLDREAFGDRFAAVAKTPIVLPDQPNKLSLRTVLDIAYTQIEANGKQVKTNYRVDELQLIITTPERALFTLEYDIRGLLGKSEIVGVTDAVFRKADQAKKAALLVQRIVALLEPDFAPNEIIQIVNGSRVLIRTIGTRHATFAPLIPSLGRWGDLAVTSTAKLYEVDDAYYTKLKNVKRRSLEEEERIFLDGKVNDGPYKGLSLDKQKLILTGDEVRVDAGQSATLLARQEFRQCMPGPDQVRKGDKSRQSFVTGIIFNGEFSISPDRRFVRVKLTEQAIELLDIQKHKVLVPRQLSALQVDEKVWKEAGAEVPILKASTQSLTLDLADGGTILVPVQYRPRALQEKNKWLVLSITSRIIIEEEERAILFSSMEEAIPALVNDVLNNPRLKTTRDYCGTPGDKRFALVDSESWTWPKEFRPKVAGFELTPAKAAGKRLLGIRIDSYRTASDLAIRVTLVNAGGSENGVAIGGCTLSYNARSGDKGWSVQLVEP